MANIVDAILRLTDNFTPTLVKAQDGLTKYSRQAQRMSKDLNKIGNSITNMGKSLTLGVTAPIVGIGTKYRLYQVQQVSNLSYLKKRPQNLEQPQPLVPHK